MSNEIRSANATSFIWGALTLALIIVIPGPSLRDTSWLDTLFLLLVAALLGTANIQLKYGIINMSGAAVSAAVATLSPLQATLVGLAGGADRAWRRRRTDPIPSNLGGAFWGAGGAAVRYACVDHGLSAPSSVAIALLAGVAINVITVSVSLSFRTSTPVGRILRQILTPGFAFAYTYFLIAAALASTMLDHSYGGLIKASGLFVLAIAIGDSVGGRTIRAFLERQLVAVEPHVQYSRLAQGTFHDLRNHVSTAIANLNDINERGMSRDEQMAFAAAMAAIQDARRILEDAQRSGGVTGAADFVRVDVGELCRHTAGLHRRVATSRRISVAVDTPDAEVAVFGHPVLLGEVLTNLILNAIDATPPGGSITIRCATVGSDAMVAVSDSGPGVSQEAVGRIFEPGFTTKAARGSGLGLYTALGIARQHHGDLAYASPATATGATFVITLPSFEVGRRTLGTNPFN